VRFHSCLSCDGLIVEYLQPESIFMQQWLFLPHELPVRPRLKECSASALTQHRRCSAEQGHCRKVANGNWSKRFKVVNSSLYPWSHLDAVHGVQGSAMRHTQA